MISFPRVFLWLLLALPVVEIIAFWLVAAKIGFLSALLALLALSLIGAMVVAQSGRALLASLGAAFSQQGAGNRVELPPGGFLTALGGILMALPGFVSSAVGLALLVPGLQQRLRRRMGRPAARPRQEEARARPFRPGSRPDSRPGAHDNVIDLGPDEWRQVSDQASDQVPDQTFPGGGSGGRPGTSEER